MTKIELKLTELGTDKFIDKGDIFYDIKERPTRYQVANATFGCIPHFMLCALDLFNTNGGGIIATSTTETGHIFNLPYTVEGLPEEFVRAYVAGGMDNSRVRYNGNISEIYYLSEDGTVINEIPLGKPEPSILGLTELPIEEPVGKFILEQQDIKPVMTHNGAYYYYADVCKLIERAKGLIAGMTKEEKVKESAKAIYKYLLKEREGQKEEESHTDLHKQRELYKKYLKERELRNNAVDFMNWTLSGDCEFTCTDEDSWNGPDYMETRITYTTQEVYEYYLKFMSENG